MSFEDLIQTGLKALDMARAHGLAVRLVVGKLDELEADITGLGGLVPRAIETKKEAQVATATQQERLAEGWARVTAIRMAVKRTADAADVRKAWGIGTKSNQTSVKNVLAMIDQMVARAASNPTEFRAAGLLSTDIDAMKAAAGAIRDADVVQEARRARAPFTTRERNLAGDRIIKSI
ncbi:MAG: hypothetical protein HY901_28950, partial [Deltaproteobacteria bacterium]|nr:hypothetical protein [Deltaproteobacteria bacterium]